jgi:hypothetical protein
MTSASVNFNIKVQSLCAITKRYDILNSIGTMQEIPQLRQIMDEFPNISGFNYRVARHKVGNDAYYRIHECFYDEN